MVNVSEMWTVWVVLSVLCGTVYTRQSDADCVTSEGTVGSCTVPSECVTSFHSLKPKLCRYSRGYGMRICCPRSSVSSHFSYTNSRDDFYNDDQPLTFPSEPSYSEFHPHVRPTTQSYNSNPFFEDSYYQPFNPRPSYNRPQYHEKPSFSSNPYDSSFEYQDRPKPSYGFQGQSSPSYNERPEPSYGFQGDSSTSYQGRPKPSNGFQGQTSPSHQGRPKPTNGLSGGSRPSHSSHGSSDRNKPRPATWEAPEPENPWEYQPTRRTTTAQPTWAVEDNVRETSSNSKKRISERKCEEYSRAVTQTIDALPLSINAEVVPLTVQKCDFSAVKLVVGGEASELGEFPHMAALGFNTPGSRSVIWNCGGTLISDRFVMTAGHCVNTSYGNPVVVRLGEYNLARDDDGADPEDYSIERIVVHPNYFKTLKYNDIALIKLNRAVRFDKWIRPACLPSDDTIREKPVATGWGRTDFVGKLSDILMKVSLSVIDNRQCNSFYSTKNPGSSSFSSGIIDSMICAGELEGGRDTCLGDSGGPLSITKRDNPCVHYVVGITSFGKVCAAPNSPGVYTRVSKYLSWIERTVWS